MNNLLPNKEELIPIIKPLNTFYECGFNTNFDNLKEEKKISILCDLVKETIYPNPIPNPKTEIEELNGNGFTACDILDSYIKEMDCCKNSKIVLANGRTFDIEESLNYHPILLIQGKDNITYQVNPSPFIGYKTGTVEPLINPIYYEYVKINDKMRKYIQTIKEIIYTDKKNEFNKKKINEYIDICITAMDYKSLKIYSLEALKILIKYTDNIIIKDKIKELTKNIELNEKEIEKQIILLEKQISIWKEELNDLKGTDKEAKHQLELSQWIIQEGKRIHQELEREREINGENIKLSMINPRILYELGYNTIFIKTSAFFLGYQDIIRNSFIEKYPYTGEYSINLAEPTEQTGIKPMLFSHPLGENCIRSLTGESRILLLKANPESINKQKKQFRNKICGPLWGKELIWYDGKPILWDPMITNIVHGSDHAPEAALHYLIGNPEHQNMTRFMYPNPKLIYKKNKKDQ